jgi:hypothetical protein
MKLTVHQGDNSITSTGGFRRTRVQNPHNPIVGEVEVDELQLTPEQRHYFIHLAQLSLLASSFEENNGFVDAPYTPTALTLTDLDRRIYPDLSQAAVVDLISNCARLSN